MAFVRTWLLPRVGFWLIWTAWLWCLQQFLMVRFEGLPGHVALMLVVGPPMMIGWAGSRLVKNALDSPNALFWKAAALSCLLGAFANMLLMKEIGWGPHILIVAGLICGYLGLRAPGLQKVVLTEGELFERARFIARRSGVSVNRILVFRSPRNLPTAFAQRNTGAILLSERLLSLLSRRETEAVIAHEAAHLRPMQKLVTSALPLVAAFMILVGSLWPAARIVTPLMPLLGLLLWRALRRIQEYDADSTAIRATGDPEALIAALARISRETGMPLHWNRVAGLFLPHPPMTARFRSIARKGGLNSAQMEEIISAVKLVPALPGFESPFGRVPPDAGSLSVHRTRLAKRMMVLSKVFPILAGAGFAARERFQATDLPGLVVHTAVWTIAAMVVYWAAYEIIAGWERRRLRPQLPGAYREGSYFAGVSTGAEPQNFEGMYHYDLGLVRIDSAFLQFAGTRCSFSIGSSEARRVWLANGPPHWTPRRVVCIEYQTDSGQGGVVSLQPLERWFWPATSSAAQSLLAVLAEWSNNAERSPVTPTIPPPHIAGTVLPRVRLVDAWKAMRMPCMVSFCVSWLIFQIPALDPAGMLTPMAASLVTSALILFRLFPHLEWRDARPAPAFPKAE